MEGERKGEKKKERKYGGSKGMREKDKNKTIEGGREKEREKCIQGGREGEKREREKARESNLYDSLN